MKLLNLQITDIRNIKHAKLADFAELNLFYGENGAGKTSILEAIHFLGLARSFRSVRIKPLIHHEARVCRVVADFEDRGKEYKVGIERPLRGGFTIKVNGQKASSAAELAQLIPLQLLNSESFTLLSGGPKERRKMIDWGVFHVEHAFMEHWGRSKQAIRQRNSLLRAGKASPDLSQQLQPWDKEIAHTSVLINRMRQNYVDRLVPVIRKTLLQLLEQKIDIAFAFRGGWGQRSSLDSVESVGPSLGAADYLEILQANLGRDQKSGLTHFGPHRADLDITVNGSSAVDILSRGQQKLVVSAIKLAQCRLFEEDTGRKSILLADDIPAEVDEKHQVRLLELFAEQGLQCFLTAISKDMLANAGTAGSGLGTDARLFHVKQGEVVALP